MRAPSSVHEPPLPPERVYVSPVNETLGVMAREMTTNPRVHGTEVRRKPQLPVIPPELWAPPRAVRLGRCDRPET